MILLGAAIMLVSYFLRDVVREDVRDRLAAMNAGASEYRTNLPSLEQQTADLGATSKVLAGDPASIPREKVLLAIEKLTNRQIENLNELFAFWNNMPDVPKNNLVEIREIVGRTEEVSAAWRKFVEQAPPDARALVGGALSLVQQLSEVNGRTSTSGAELQVFELEESKRLKHQSSFYGEGITVLYILGLALTVLSGLYGVELPNRA
jgi:hypothetical protein